MSQHARRSTAVLTSAALLGIAPLSTASAAPLEPSRISVHATDTTPQRGTPFRLFGVLTSQGDPVHPATVRVQSRQGNTWVRIRGALVSTNPDGHYRVRLVLSRLGTRDLRVVGNPADPDIRNARREITVRVHR